MPVYLVQEPSFENNSFEQNRLESQQSSTADLPKAIQTLQAQQRQSKQQQLEQTIQSDPSDRQEDLLQDRQIIVQEQEINPPQTPIRSFKSQSRSRSRKTDNCSGIHSRKSSRLKEPKFPEPVEEAKQRFSTPRRRASYSPMSSLSPKTQRADVLITARTGSITRARRPDYPVVVRKNKIIRGPVLKSNYDRATMQNGRFTMAFKKRRKTAENKKLASQDDINSTPDETDNSTMMQAKFSGNGVLNGI